jgi:hypothetical protein
MVSSFFCLAAGPRSTTNFALPTVLDTTVGAVVRDQLARRLTEVFCSGGRGSYRLTAHVQVILRLFASENLHLLRHFYVFTLAHKLENRHKTERYRKAPSTKIVTKNFYKMTYSYFSKSTHFLGKIDT